MTDKKLTDKEIVQTLECCLCDNSECLQCQNKELCKIECDELATQTIELINRKMEEIERLKTEIERIQKARLKQAQFLAEQKAQKYELINKLSRAKSEAYKEFVERLKEKLDDCHIISDGEYCGFDCGDIHECINTSLKEMVGEKE